MLKPERTSPGLYPAAVILLSLASFGIYAALARQYPVVYWYDAHIRLALHDQLVIGQWLPLLQVIILLVSKITTDLFVLRVLLSFLAALTIACMYLFAARFFSRGTGLIAAAFLAVNLMFAALATVPYPEVLFTGLVLVALTLMDAPVLTRRYLLGLLALNLACLARYEAWLLTGIFVLEAAVRCFRPGVWKETRIAAVKTAVLCGIAPLAWLLFGVTGPGGLAVRLRTVIAFETESPAQSLANRFFSSLDLNYLGAFVRNYYKLLDWQLGLGVVLLGVFGWYLAIRFTEQRALHWRMFAFLVADLLLLALWQPQDFTSLRTAYIGEMILIPYAAYGLNELARILFQKLAAFTQDSHLAGWQTLATTVVVLTMVFVSARKTVEFVAASAQETAFYLPAQAGSWLAQRVTSQDAIWVLHDEDHFPTYAVAVYTGLPFIAMLDDRLDQHTIETRTAGADRIFVVEMQRSNDDLSPVERTLLDDLESGRIPAQPIWTGAVRVWIIIKGGWAAVPAPGQFALPATLPSFR